MTAKILSGDEIAAEIRASVGTLRARVVVVANRDDPRSAVYLGMQRRTLKQHGVDVGVEEIGASTGEAAALQLVRRLNDDKSVTGISVHLPPPAGIDPLKITTAILPTKDIEGTHPFNIGMVSFRDRFPTPCAARAAYEFVLRERPDLKGLDAVVVGRSAMVGRPVASMLLHSKAAPTVTICHTATRDLSAQTRRADIVVAAAGQARLITGAMLKPGALVVDIGINPEGDTIVGDVEFNSAKNVAGAITPVPGGVGPVCLAMLLRNVAACSSTS